MKLSDMKSFDEVLSEQLEDPIFRQEWHGGGPCGCTAGRYLPGRAWPLPGGLARELGVSQPLVTRVDADEHEPTFATLSRLSRRLGLEFHIDITSTALEMTV